MRRLNLKLMLSTHDTLKTKHSKKLLHKVSQIWQITQVTRPFDGLRDFTLVFQRVASDAAWQQFALFVDELKQKLSVFVINVFDSEFAETAIFFALLTNIRITEKFYIISTSRHLGYYFFLFDDVIFLILN